METDPQLRAELEVCEVYRIPHSHYLGGPPEWTALDREKAEAYLAWKKSFCSDCGTRDQDWDPELGGDRFMYVGATKRCVGCEVLEMERETIPDDAKGIKVFLTPNPNLLDPVFIEPQAA